MNIDRFFENNALPFAQPFPIDDPDGFETVTVVAKLAWHVDARGHASIAQPQRGVRLHDIRHAGVNSSVRFPSDYAPDKPGTDIILLGRALPPAGDKPSTDVGLRIETGARTIEKRLRVFGRRVFMKKVRKVVPGPAQPLKEAVPLVYELAAGGRDPRDYHLFDPHNPVGMGTAKEQDRLIGEEAHRIESLSGNGPAGFGPIASNWSPRVEHYGTLDDEHMRSRHPVAPADFDARYFSCANPDLWCEEPLVGDEPFEIVGVTPESPWRFKLPRYLPRFDVTVDGTTSRADTHLDTMLIDVEDPRERIVELSWRVAVRLPNKSERLDKIEITDATEVPRHWYAPVHDHASPTMPTNQP
jgi:hypothetical protein